MGSSKSGQLPVFRVKGTVIFGGEPLAGAKLFFHPDSPLEDANGKPMPLPSAYSKEDGSFVATTYRPGDGLPQGEYLVTVSCPDTQQAAVDGSYPELLPPRYQDPRTSDLAVSIIAGQNSLQPFELNR